MGACSDECADVLAETGAYVQEDRGGGWGCAAGEEGEEAWVERAWAVGEVELEEAELA